MFAITPMAITKISNWNTYNNTVLLYLVIFKHCLLQCNFTTDIC